MKFSTLLAAVIGAIVMFVLGFLFFGILLSSFFEANMSKIVKDCGIIKNPPDILFIFLFNLVWAWLMAFVFEHWATIRTFTGGARAGAIIMLAVVLGLNLQSLAFMNFYTSITPPIVDIVVVTVMGAITGGVIGFVLGFFGKTAEAD